MILKTMNHESQAANTGKPKILSKRAGGKGSRVTQARAKAQRAKLAFQAEACHIQDEREAGTPTTPNKKAIRQEMQIKRRVIATLIEAYLQDHMGGNSSEKTLEWHRTALGLMQLFLKEELDITLIEEVEADDISAWFAHMRSTPAARGKVRSERTIQTYARSARAFFHWLVRRGTLQSNPFERVAFPKVGRPLIQTITTEEFEQLLLACAPPHETGPYAERAAGREVGGDHSLAEVRLDPRHGGHRALEADLGVGSVAERLVGGAAAAAQEDRLAGDLDRLALGIDQLHWPLHLVRPVLGGGDPDLGHLILLRLDGR